MPWLDGTTTARTQQEQESRLLAGIRPESKGAVGDGVTADTAAISAAMDEANTIGVPLLLGSKVYSCGVIAKTYKPNVVGVPGSTILVNTPTTGHLWSFTGSLGSSASLTGTTAVGSAVVAVPTTGIVAGDLVVIGQNVTSDAAAGNGQRWQGQQAQVLSIDSGSQLTLLEPAIFAYTVASGAFVRRVAPLDGARIKGVRFQCTTPGTTPQGFVKLSYAKDIDIDIEMVKGAYVGLQLRSCYHGSVRANCRDFIYNAANGQYAYAVGVYMASAHLNLEVHDRHGAITVAVDHENDQYGEPMDIEITGSVHDATMGPWNTHQFGYDVRFVNCVTRNVGNSGSGAGADHAIDARCRKVQVIGGSAWNVTNGSGIGQAGLCTDLEIQGYRVRGADCGLKADTALTRLHVTGCDFDDLQAMPYRVASTVTELLLARNSFRRWGIGGVGGENYGGRFYAIVTKGLVAHNTWTDPHASASNEASFFVAGGEVRVVNNVTNNLAGATPFPTVSGVTYTNNTDI